MTARSAAAYEWAGIALARASTDPGGLDLPGELGGTDPGSLAAQARWLSRAWGRDEVRAALAVASPALCEQAGKILASGQAGGSDASRVVWAVASYLLRWQRRATPFGLFAGVALARVGGPSRARWNARRAVARADAAWLGDVIAALERNRELLGRLDVVASDAVTGRGGRLTAPGPVPDGAGRELAPVEVSVRGTRPVRAVMEAAGEPVAAGKLAAHLATLFPDAPAGQVTELLAGLVTQGLLVTSLRAPMTCPDPLGHACDRLAEARAGDIPGISGIVAGLEEARRALRDADCGHAEPVTVLAGRMRTLSQAAAMPLAVDTVLDCDIRVPDQVAREAADAAGVLCRVSPFPHGEPAWADYHARFLDRYGSGAVVPVLDLVADSGLGFPAGYPGSARELPPRAVTRRDAILARLIQQAMADDFSEIRMTSELIEELAAGTAADPVRVPPRAEIAVEVRARSLAALDSGRFTLMVTGAPPPASSMIGRHACLLPEADRDLLAATFGGPGPAVVTAQLSFVPRKRRNENVARTGQLLPAVIPVGEHRGGEPGLIRLADLAVSADEGRFWLLRLPAGDEVRPLVPHALEARTHTPPLARFIAELGTARCAAYMPFDFGATARQLPWLPRVRCRRTILAPARWRLQVTDLPGPDVPQAQWERALGAWRARWRVPEVVAITDHDRHQPADLDHPAHLRLLRTRLRRAGRLELRETATPGELAWIGRAHQLVLPLTAPAAPRPRIPVDGRQSRDRREIIRARITCHPGHLDEIVTGHLPLLPSAIPNAARCWFRCQGHPGGPDAGTHLAVYLLPASADAASYRSLAGDLAVWAGGLESQRLASGLGLDTFHLPDGPYGGGPALESVPAVLAADSAAAIAQVTLSLRAGLDRAAVTAASLADLAASLAASRAEGMGWLAACLERQPARIDPAVRDQAFRLTAPDVARTALAGLPGGADVAAAWEQRARALDDYRRSLEGQRDPRDVLPALLRDHLARAAFPDAAAKRTAGHLARACALRGLATAPEA